MRRLLAFKSIKTKILFGFGVLIVLVFGMGTLSYLSIHNIHKDMDEIISKQLPLLVLDEDLLYTMSQSTSLTGSYFLFGDEQVKERLKENFEKAEQIEQDMLAISDLERLNYLFDLHNDFEAMVWGAIEEFDKGNEEKAVKMIADFRPITNELIDAFEELSHEKESNILQLGDNVLAVGRGTITFMLMISGIVIVIGVFAAWVTSVSITRPVLRVMKRMQDIAEGDLSQEPLTTQGQDEIAQLILATNTMSMNTHQLLDKINEVSQSVSSQSEELMQAAGEVTTGTEQMARTMEELASGSETQADHASSLASAMGSFTSKVAEVNENGEWIQTNSNKVLEMTMEGTELMQSSTEQMKKINHIMKDAVENMKNLDQESQEITKLVFVIKDVAEQTNLLALNAAIEAARAGEHGRGFAVVADEVRKLAEQVAHSVTEISQIVSKIQNESKSVVYSLVDGYQEVEQGTSQIEITGNTFQEISEAVTQMAQNITAVSANLSEIAASSQEMNGFIEEIASVSEEAAAGIEETAASAQQVSGSMEEVSASSRHLASLADELNELVGQFKL